MKNKLVNENDLQFLTYLSAWSGQKTFTSYLTSITAQNKLIMSFGTIWQWNVSWWLTSGNMINTIKLGNLHTNRQGSFWI